MSFAAALVEFPLKIRPLVRWAPIVYVFLARPTFAQPLLDAPSESLFAPDPSLKSTVMPKNQQNFGWGFEASGASGLGSFRDIQIPINRYFDMRADGRRIGAENEAHMGLVLGGQVGPIWQLRNIKLRPFSVSLVRMTAISGPSETLNSSYNRLTLDSKMEWVVSLGRPSLTIEFGAGFRRSEFSNTSSGHYVASIPVGFGLGFGFPHWLIKGFGHYGLQNQVGYSESLFFGGGALKGATADLTDFGIMGEVRLTSAAWLELGIEQESARIQIPNVKTYEEFGFEIEDPKRKRDYNMTTSSLTVGVRKTF